MSNLAFIDHVFYILFMVFRYHENPIFTLSLFQSNSVFPNFFRKSLPKMTSSFFPGIVMGFSSCIVFLVELIEISQSIASPEACTPTIPWTLLVPLLWLSFGNSSELRTDVPAPLSKRMLTSLEPTSGLFIKDTSPYSHKPAPF